MVHVATPRPSLGAAIGQGFGQGFTQGLDQRQQMQQQEQQRSLLSNALAQATQIWNSGIPEEQKILGLNQVLSGFNPAISKNIVDQLQQAQKNKLPSKADLEAQESAQVKNTAQTAFNRMAEIIKNKRLGLGSELKGKLIGGKIAKDVGEFQSLSGGLEAILVDMVNRGTLSNARFKYITETLLPKPGDREDTIKGKMEGLAQLLDLDPSALGEEQNPSKKEEKAGFVKLKDPQGIERWVPEEIAKKLKG